MIARRGKVIYADQVGWQDREAGVPMAEDTIFRMYSMTKPVVYAALMTLYEEGRFQLTDPVAKFIPAFGATKVLDSDGSLVDQNPLRPMQVRDLMTHTSGLTYDFLEDFPVGAQYRDARLMNDATRSLGALIAELARFPLAFQPGTMWHYSLGTDVAAHLIEVISGKPLGQFLHERLFEPLGMSDTAFGVPETQRHRLSAMYGFRDINAPGMTFGALYGEHDGNVGRREVQDTYPVDAPDVFQRGGTGLFSTASDYLRFAMMLLHGRAGDGTRILGRKTLELMHTNHLPADLLPFMFNGRPFARGYGFGLGSRVAMDVGATAVYGSVGEFGWGGAAKTYFWVDPVEDLVGLFMTQFMGALDNPQNDLRALAYQAIDD
jgi:CubicO group peptidase (beta-lactamase class C family)